MNCTHFQRIFRRENKSKCLLYEFRGKISSSATKTICLASYTELELEEYVSFLVRKCPNMRILRQIHSCLIPFPPSSAKRFCLSKIVGFCALSPFGDMIYARLVFSGISKPTIYAWNAMIRGCCLIQNPSKEPFYLYKRMLKMGFSIPNSFTLAFVLKGCTLVLALEEGHQIHSQLLRYGLGSSPFVQTALLNLYAKCKEIVLARKLFDEITYKNLFTWTTMISGYAKIGLVNETFQLFQQMQTLNLLPDVVTMVGMVSACAKAGALDLGRWFHELIGKRGIIIDVKLGTALIDMYTKCGCINRARELFHGIPNKDAKAWNTMILGFATHGLSEDALETFSKMEHAKVTPNKVTFVGVLSACVHGGLVSKGREYWLKMLEFGIIPTMEHYGCLVDLLCRSGFIDEAYNYIKIMPISPNSVIWRTLLLGCKNCGALELGHIVAKHLLELEPFNADNYILLSNMYAENSRWEGKVFARNAMEENCLKAISGCSIFESDGFICE